MSAMVYEYSRCPLDISNDIAGESDPIIVCMRD